jgi:hypothetical protein
VLIGPQDAHLRVCSSANWGTPVCTAGSSGCSFARSAMSSVNDWAKNVGAGILRVTDQSLGRVMRSDGQMVGVTVASRP